MRQLRNGSLWIITVLFITLGTSCKGPSESTSIDYDPIEITTPSNVVMILVPGGEFMMGTDAGADDERPLHTVVLTGFAMDKYEVTQDQLAAMELPDPSHFKDPRRPVEQIRWSDAALFCNIRSQEDGLTPCYDEVTFECDFEADGYRLPTEAEWEYAARCGADGDYCFGDSTEKLKNYACYADNSTKKTDLVGRKRANAWGFHDMHGNVYEWCHDVHDPRYYEQVSPPDPRGPDDGKERILRGGAWNTRADSCRSAARASDVPGITDACFARDTYGFRCVRRLSSEESQRIDADAILQGRAVL